MSDVKKNYKEMTDEEIARDILPYVRNVFYGVLKFSIANTFGKYKCGEELTDSEMELLKDVNLFDERKYEKYKNKLN